jgi:hypothetical protein
MTMKRSHSRLVRLNSLGISTLKAEHAKLTENKNALNAEYAKLKRQAREIGVIESNVDSILEPTKSETRSKERDITL